MNFKRNISRLIDDLELILRNQADNAVASCSRTLVAHPRYDDVQPKHFSEVDGYYTPLGLAFLHAEDIINDSSRITTREPTLVHKVEYFEPPRSTSIISDAVVFTFHKDMSQPYRHATTVYHFNSALEDAFNLPKSFWDEIDNEQELYMLTLDSKGFFEYCIEKLKEHIIELDLLTIDNILL